MKCEISGSYGSEYEVYRVFWNVVSRSQDALKMVAVRTSETLVNINLTTWRYIPEDSKLQFMRCSTQKKGNNKKKNLCTYVIMLKISNTFSMKFSPMNILILINGFCGTRKILHLQVKPETSQILQSFKCLFKRLWL
jgi:hypothetical protein